MRGKGYGWIEFVDEGGWEHSRKLYKKERKEIMMNYIRRRSGRRFKVSGVKFIQISATKIDEIK